jgi:hypothetical protein
LVIFSANRLISAGERIRPKNGQQRVNCLTGGDENRHRKPVRKKVFAPGI